MIEIVPNHDPELNRQGDEILRRLASQCANPIANRQSLSEQFEYDFWSQEEDVGLYAIRIRKYFRVVIAVFMEANGFEAFRAISTVGPKMVKPFDPAETQISDYRKSHMSEGVHRWRVLQGIN
jgi:hypothetical protein